MLVVYWSSVVRVCLFISGKCCPIDPFWSQLVSDEEPTEDEEGEGPGGGDGDALVDGGAAQAPPSQGDVPQALGEGEARHQHRGKLKVNPNDQFSNLDLTMGRGIMGERVPASLQSVAGTTLVP